MCFLTRLNWNDAAWQFSEIEFVLYQYNWCICISYKIEPAYYFTHARTHNHSIWNSPFRKGWWLVPPGLILTTLHFQTRFLCILRINSTCILEHSQPICSYVFIYFQAESESLNIRYRNFKSRCIIRNIKFVSADARARKKFYQFFRRNRKWFCARKCEFIQ